MFTAGRTDQPQIGVAAVKSSSKSSSKSSQRLLMLLALALLLTTLLVVVVGTDWQFWRSSILSAWSEITGPSASNTTAQQTSPPASPQARSRKHKQVAAPLPPETQTTTLLPSHRLALAPLEVEVIAHGNHGQTIRTRNSAINLDLQANRLVPRPEATTKAELETGVTDASEQVRISPDTAELVSNPVGPTYPLLARQMRVQGSVVLQARIGKDGDIQDLQVLKGPEILSSAAVEAVKQWRFKPHLQAGQRVETDARITVYFTIATR
jgi:TonB family protein